jgi:hypothetical protein
MYFPHTTLFDPPAPVAAPAPDQDQLTSAIKIARVICIMGVVYVHAWTGLVGHNLTDLDHSVQGMLRWTLMELFGHSAVPLLSIISGWLVAGSLRKRTWRQFLLNKMRTILAPMLLWNALAILLVSSAAWLGWIEAPMPTTLRWTVDELFCLWTPDDINVQMPFLRDLFVCMLAAPLIVRMPSRVLAMLSLAGFGLTVAGYPVFILLRPSILSFFAIGIIARRMGAHRKVAAWPIALSALPYAAMAALNIWLQATGSIADSSQLASALDLATRATAALFYWAVAWRLAASRLSAPLLRIEPYAFLMFCSHLIMIWLLGPLIGRVTGPLGSPLYPAFLLLQPILVMLAAIGLGRAIRLCSPPAAKILSGGRLAPSREKGGAFSAAGGNVLLRPIPAAARGSANPIMLRPELSRKVLPGSWSWLSSSADRHRADRTSSPRHGWRRDR